MLAALFDAVPGASSHGCDPVGFQLFRFAPPFTEELSARLTEGERPHRFRFAQPLPPQAGEETKAFTLITPSLALN